MGYVLGSGRGPKRSPPGGSGRLFSGGWKRAGLVIQLFCLRTEKNILPFMLDWFSGLVGYNASNLELGRVLEFSPEGEVIRERDRWETARGSWESGVQITRGSPTSEMLEASRTLGRLCSDQAILRVSGNPLKLLQGHNVAGPSVCHEVAIVQGMCRAFPESLRPCDAWEERLPAVHRSRIDLTTHVDLGSDQEVHDWLKLAATNTRSRHGRALMDEGTVYWGKDSRRWTLKAYCKHCELGKHPCLDPVFQPLAVEWCRGHVRIELTIRGPELKGRSVLNEPLIWEFCRKVETAIVKKSSSVVGFNLPTPALACLLLWKDGVDVTKRYSRATFYRHRSQILTVVGVDISLDYSGQLEVESPSLLGFDELERREVVEIPDFVEKTLFKVS